MNKSPNESTALRKRAQINRANRLMFAWVAGASILISVALVVSVVTVRQGIHNQKAIAELHTTEDTIKENNKKIDELENQIRSLGSDENLLRLRNNDSDNALRVVLDALPADVNPSALGASIQNKLLRDRSLSGLDIESVRVQSLDTIDISDYSIEDGVAGTIEFSFVVSGTANQLKTLLMRLEKSIRTIDVGSVKLESRSGNKQRMTVAGVAYYSPAVQLHLGDKKVNL